MPGVVIRYDKCLRGWYLEYNHNIMFVEDPQRVFSANELQIMAVEQLG